MKQVKAIIYGASVLLLLLFAGGFLSKFFLGVFIGGLWVFLNFLVLAWIIPQRRWDKFSRREVFLLLLVKLIFNFFILYIIIKSCLATLVLIGIPVGFNLIIGVIVVEEIINVCRRRRHNSVG